MMCRICFDQLATDRQHAEPAGSCDSCLAAIGDIRVWLRESGHKDSLENAVALRRLEVNSGKAVAR